MPSDHPKDECTCGDYRRDHPDNGPCVFNSRDNDLTHGNENCLRFELYRRAQPEQDTP